MGYPLLLPRADRGGRTDRRQLARRSAGGTAPVPRTPSPVLRSRRRRRTGRRTRWHRRTRPHTPGAASPRPDTAGRSSRRRRSHRIGLPVRSRHLHGMRRMQRRPPQGKGAGRGREVDFLPPPALGVAFPDSVEGCEVYCFRPRPSGKRERLWEKVRSQPRVPMLPSAREARWRGAKHDPALDSHDTRIVRSEADAVRVAGRFSWSRGSIRREQGAGRAAVA